MAGMPSRRLAGRSRRQGDTVSFMLSLTFFMTIGAAGLVLILILLGRGDLAGTIVLVLGLVLATLAGLFLAGGAGAAR